VTIPAPEYPPLPADACGQLLDLGTPHPRRCGVRPVVGRLTERYAVGERPSLCAEHRAQYPATIEYDGETIPAVEPV
jgi:hypothetical protein